MGSGGGEEPRRVALKNDPGIPRAFSTAVFASKAPVATTSTGSGDCVPRRSTSFPSSTIIRSLLLAWATIFSRSSAPPNPLMRFRLGSTSSAPSTVKSREPASSNVVRGIPRARASVSVRREVGTPTIPGRSPDLKRTERALRKWATVLPVPSPRTIPGKAASAARDPANSFPCSVRFS